VKISQALAGAVLISATLAACSGSSDGGDAAGGSYCKDIKAAKPTFETLASGNLAELEKGFTTFHRLADESPDELKDQWKVLDEAADSVEDKLKEAGLTFDDLPDIQAGKLPEGVSVEKLTAFAADLQKLNNDTFAEARTAIGKQAKDVCGVELGAG
jgi:hypothetical protein